MPEENVAIVRRGVEEFIATGRLSAEVADDFVWDMNNYRGWPDEPLYHGRDEFYEFMAAWRGPYDDWHLTLDDVLDPGGEHILALMTQKGKLRGSDSDVQLQFALLYTIRGGLIQCMQVYSLRAEGPEAAGLAA
jgi:hypothetical protein